MCLDGTMDRVGVRQLQRGFSRLRTFFARAGCFYDPHKDCYCVQGQGKRYTFAWWERASTVAWTPIRAATRAYGTKAYFGLLEQSVQDAHRLHPSLYNGRDCFRVALVLLDWLLLSSGYEFHTCEPFQLDEKYQFV